MEERQTGLSLYGSQTSRSGAGVKSGEAGTGATRNAGGVSMAKPHLCKRRLGGPLGPGDEDLAAPDRS
jgi:hypothetical protein